MDFICKSFHNIRDGAGFQTSFILRCDARKQKFTFRRNLMPEFSGISSTINIRAGISLKRYPQSDIISHKKSMLISTAEPHFVHFNKKFTNTDVADAATFFFANEKTE